MPPSTEKEELPLRATRPSDDSLRIVMNRNASGIIRCLVLLQLFSALAAGQTRRVDLRDWGYRAPESPSAQFQTQLSTQIISGGQHGDILTGFVTRDQTGLATRKLPPLSLHVVRFTKDGEFLSQEIIPTPSWNENAILFGADGDLLIRTGTKLSLLSPQMQRLADRELPLTLNGNHVYWRILPLPNRSGFLLHNLRGSDESIALYNWKDLTAIRECAYSPHDEPLSVWNKNILSFRPGRKENPLRREVTISEICGPFQFTYSWDEEPMSAQLADDSSIILAGGGPSVSLVVNEKVQWKHVFNKKSDVVSNHVEVSADGQVLAIAVKEFRGGSRVLDISSKLKSIEVVVYQAKTGEKVLAVSVNPTPSSSFDFALSPLGDLLAIVSDGFMEIVPISPATN